MLTEGTFTVKKISIVIFSALLILSLAGCEPRQAPVPVPLVPAPPDVRMPGSVISLEEVRNYTFHIWESGTFELPVQGATGWAAIDIPLFDTAHRNSSIIATLPMGQAFTILDGGIPGTEWWYIEVNDATGATITGWVLNLYCMINLPDVLPSIVYRNPNIQSAMFRSSGRDIPNITGLPLSCSRDFNARLGREEDIAATLYRMARKIGVAQQAALAEGNTLIIYEAFRPHDLQEKIYENLRFLYETDPVVRAGISTPPWNIRWFLARSPYNHQRGTAIDVSLGRIDHYEIRVTGDYAFINISGYTAFPMQTPMHELSIAAVVFRTPAHARSLTAWRDAEFAETATPGTILLHRYLTDAGLIPLASEWWHFNDLVHTDFAVEVNITGEFVTERSYSRPPEQLWRGTGSR